MAADSRGLAVLLVENKVLVASSYARLLRSVEPAWRIDFETDAAQGREKLLSGAYDVGLIDLELGDRSSGLDLCRAARAAGLRSALIVLSAYATDRVRAEAIDAGADDHVSKGLPISELRARIGLASLRPRWRPKPLLPPQLMATLSEAELAFVTMIASEDVVPLAVAAQRILGRSDTGSIDALYRLVERVRRKLGSGVGRIQSVRGVGYRWVPKDATSPATQRR